MKFIAIQNGARRGYAVPALLHKAGMLERFYTDMAGNVGLGRWLAASRHLLGAKSLARLASRRVPTEVLPCTKTFGLLHLTDMLSTVFRREDHSTRFHNHLELNARWSRAMIRKGFGQATHVYSMLDEGRHFMIEARRRGLVVVSEVYIMLSTERLLREERQSFPGWEPDAPDYEALRRQCGHGERLPHLADHFVCPSAAVQDDLVKNWDVAKERTSLVPYGMNPAWLDLNPEHERGRVLFVGTAELRKGIHYLAMAAERLASQGYSYEFRVAGNVTDQVRQQPACNHLTFLGRIPRDRIQEEFRSADVFVLPSLAEGSAEVTYEALASALPVITTPVAGSVARDGIEGRIIPERNTDAIATAIQQIVEDRPLRERMSHAARERAREYTWEKYAGRLIAALQSLEVVRT